MAQAVEHDTTPDPVADMGRKLVTIIAAMERNEHAQFKAVCTEGILLKQEERHLHDLLGATAEMATVMRATTAAGAMLQVMLACGDAECILSHVSDQHYDHCKEMYRRVERCLYSVLGILAEASGTDPAEMGGNYYMSSEYDPLARVAKSLAA